MRASGTFELLRRARAALLGLFFISGSLALAGCRPTADPRTLAGAFDREEHTGLYTWLVDHEPSAIVAYRIPVARVRAVLGLARILAAQPGENPCKRAQREHAALVLVTRGTSAASDRAFALDCGIALFRDESGLVIAPR